jgi:hypothetical protein
MSLIHNINAALQEDSYTSSDVPVNFRVALEVFGKSAKNKQGRHAVQLARGELKGVQGISSGKEIIMSFFGGGRDTLLVMPGKKLVQMNKITRIMYDNPHYLLQDDCTALKRIYDLKSTNECLGQVMNAFHQEAHRRFPQVYPGSQGEAAVGQDVSLANGNAGESKVNNLRDFVKWIIRGLKLHIEKEKVRKFGRPRPEYYQKILDAISPSDWRSLAEVGLREIGRVYSGEAEWVLKDSTLRIPPGSKMFITNERYSADVEKYYQEWVKLGAPKDSEELSDRDVHKYHFTNYRRWEERYRKERLVKRLGLARKYKLVYVTPERLKQLKGEVWKRRTPN